MPTKLCHTFVKTYGLPNQSPKLVIAGMIRQDESDMELNCISHDIKEMDDSLTTVDAINELNIDINGRIKQFLQLITEKTSAADSSNGLALLNEAIGGQHIFCFYAESEIGREIYLIQKFDYFTDHIDYLKLSDYINLQSLPNSEVEAMKMAEKKLIRIGAGILEEYRDSDC